MTATLTKTLGSLDDFRGTLCVPGDPDYPRVRAIWNGQVAREPALIATCHDACDVRTVLRRAVDAGMVTAVRGGGHNVAGTALCDGGVVIDLSAMRAVSLDPATGRVRVQGGATLADLDHATVPFARWPPPGSSHHRCRRADVGRRGGLDDSTFRTELRQPGRGAASHRRRRLPKRRRRARPGADVGPAGRGRQFRHCH